MLRPSKQSHHRLFLLLVFAVVMAVFAILLFMDTLVSAHFATEQQSPSPNRVVLEPLSPSSSSSKFLSKNLNIEIDGQNHHQQHQRSQPPNGWHIISDFPISEQQQQQQQRKLDENEQEQAEEEEDGIDLVFALKLRNLDRLDALFKAVSDPTSKLYGKHLTLDELTQLIAPSPQTISIVQNWISQHGISSISQTPSRDFLIARHVPLALASSLLGNLKFHRFVHLPTGRKLIRSLDDYSVPSHVAPHLSFVGGFRRFPTFHTKKSHPPHEPSRFTANDHDDDDDDQNVTPQRLYRRYNISGFGTVRNNFQSVAQFLDEFINPKDIELFQDRFQLPPQLPHAIIGPNDPSNPGQEASLDTEYIMGVAPGVPTIVWSSPGLHEGQEPFLEWILNVSSSSMLPNVISVSYGDDEDTVSREYADRINIEFQKLGVRGVSLIFASGDDGTGCTKDCAAFVPNFPATSPWVTTVGGTQFYSDIEAAIYFSSGGFSNYFPRPDYQAAAVENFLQHDLIPPSKFFNRAGRAFPDVSTLSVNFETFVGGKLIPISGTSCAAPTFAAMISLMNDMRIQSGKSPLGFLNYFIYQAWEKVPAAFFDVTLGNNRFDCCQEGFHAVAGWDAVTGVGTPNFAVLSGLAKKL